jgi:hypothetical protein
MSSTLPELDWSLYCADYEDQLATLNVDFGNFVNDDEIILSPNDIDFKAFAVADEQRSFQIQHNPTSDSFISLGELDDERKPARSFGEVYETAYQIKQPSKDLLESTAVKEKGLDCTDAKEDDLRPNDSAIEKGRKEYPGSHETTWLYDILSASVTCKTTKQLESVNKFLVQKAHIVHAKNRFVTAANCGYCDLLYHVLFDWPDILRKRGAMDKLLSDITRVESPLSLLGCRLCGTLAIQSSRGNGE